MMRAFLIAMFLASPAAAELQCATHAELVALLADQYGEVQIVRALEFRGEMIEVFVSESGTWTMLAVHPDLASCVVAAGTKWMMIAPGIEG